MRRARKDGNVWNETEQQAGQMFQQIHCFGTCLVVKVLKDMMTATVYGNNGMFLDR